MTAQTELRDAIKALLDPILDEKLGPTLDALEAIHYAVDNTADDAALGRRTREIVTEYARQRAKVPVEA